MGAIAIILAAGEGTRMRSARPKVLHEILGKPLVRWVVDAAREAGADEVVCVLGHGREQVEPLLPDVRVVVQQQQRGTADAVAAAREAFVGRSGSVLVLSGDCPLVQAQTIRDLIAAREDVDAGVALLTMTAADPTGYGRVVRAADGSVARIVEQRDCTPDQALLRECNAGTYCFDAQLLAEALGRVGSDNAQGEFYLTDVVEIANASGRAVVAVEAPEDESQGVNTRAQLARAAACMRDRINERHLLAGVTMWSPETTWIGPDVRLEADVELLPAVMLLGATSVGAGSVVGPNSRLTDTVVGRNCTIDETVAVQARIDEDCTCGPRAYLRPGTVLQRGAKAGTHVEIKKSTIGPGSKVPHLSYIGDAQLGAGVNVGAGSITCNYDGTRKWPTTIGDRVFIGSDTMMVAPVAIGDDALIGAGSTITDDVPAGALAIARAKQSVKEHYVK